MDLKVIGGLRSLLAFAAVCGVSACGNTDSDGLFSPNELPDSGSDAAAPLGDTRSSGPTSSDSSSGHHTDESTPGETTSKDASGETLDASDTGGSQPISTTSPPDTSSGPGSTRSSGSDSFTGPDYTDDTHGGETLSTSDSPEAGVPTTTETTDAGADAASTDDATTTASESTVDDSTAPSSGPLVSDTAADTGSDTDTDTSSPSGPVGPTCVISTPAKVLLNGVPSPSGDRVNSPSAPFKTSITVTTDIADGSNVILSTGSGPALLTQAIAGQAVFSGVELAPDGEYVLRATCMGTLTTLSEPLVVTVDTHGPVVGAGVVPTAGQHYSPGDDEDTSTPDALDFSVCVPVTSDDALGLDSENVCVWTGGAGPFCSRATADGVAPGVDGACVPVVCPGSAPFNIDVKVSDAAGNPTDLTVNGVTCASQTPTVEIISLTDNRTAPSDVGIRLLAANNTNPASVLKDADPQTTGAQHAVVACTNATLGSTASLRVGLQHGSVTQRATGTVQADSDHVCPTGLGGIVRFPVTTLDNSSVTSGVLQAYTVVRVLVTDTSTEVGTSPDVYVWVDPTLPILQVLFPVRLCEDGVLPTNGADVTVAMNVQSGGVYPVSGSLIRKSDNQVVGTYEFATSNAFVDVTFPLGTYLFRATAHESSGNWGALGTCEVKVADLPDIAWNRPPATTQALVGAGVARPNSVQDEDPETPGWQGSLEVTITPPLGEPLDGMQVQFRINDVPVGSPIDLDDANGEDVSVSVDVDIPDGDVEISAEVIGAVDEVISTLSVVVDTAPPGPASGLQATVLNRRETSVQLQWTAPSGGVAGYDIAYVAIDEGDVTTVIDDANFDEATRAPDAEGEVSAAVVHNLMIEQRYLFAIRPYDSSGNLGPVLATTTPVRATFESLVLGPPAAAIPGTQWGYSVDASTDLNGDGKADLVVGQRVGDVVSIYLSTAGGTYPALPDVTIQGPPGSGFGTSVAVVGNIVGDGHEDLAIAAPTDGSDLSFGRVYLVRGRAWSNELLDLTDETDPDDLTEPVIAFPATFALPDQVVRLGDYDGDGDLDFGIHANAYSPNGFCDGEENCEGAFILIKGVGDPATFPDYVEVPANTAMFEAYFPSSLDFYGADWLLGITDLVSNRSGVLAAEYNAGAQRILTRNPGALVGFDAQVLAYGPPVISGGTLVFDTEIGSYPAALAGSNTLAVQLTGARDGLRTTSGIVDLYSLSSTNTFNAPYKTFQAGGDTNNFGQILIGNRYSGRPSSYSLPFFGSNPEAPSLIMGGGKYQGKLPKLFMLGPQTLAELSETTSVQELTGVADVEYLLSNVPGLNPAWVDDLGVPSADADWHGGIGFAIRDMNGDGFADIGVTEWEASGLEPSNYTGGIIILY